MRLTAAFCLAALLAPADEREDLKNARAALRRGDYAAAERLYKSVADARPDAWDVRARLVEAQSAAGKMAEAEKTCRDFLFKHKDSAPAMAALSGVKLARGDAQGALDAAGASDDVRAAAARAEALAALGRRDEAAKALDGFPNIKRDDLMKEPLVALARGLVLLDELAGKPDAYKLAVERILPDILRADPDPAVRAMLGHIHLSRHRREPAAPAFAEALQANANLTSAHVGQGALALEGGDFAGAIAAADRALAVNASHAEAQALKARALWWRDGKGPPKAMLDSPMEQGRMLQAGRRFAEAAKAFEAAGANLLAGLNRFRAEAKPFQPPADTSDALATDLAKLFDALEKDYARVGRAHVPKREQRWLEPWLRELPADATVIVCEKPADVAALSWGVPGAGALGKVVAVPLPQPVFSWLAAIDAGLRQSAALAKHGPLPRWALEGMMQAPNDLALILARRDGTIQSPADAPAAAWRCALEKGLEKVDAEFAAWLDARLAKIRFVPPPKPDDRRITDADSDTKDAAKAVVAAHDALARNQLDRCIKYAKQAVAADAKCAAAHSLLGQALQKRRKNEEAYESLKKAAELGADDYRTWYAMGDALEDLDDAKGAIEAFGKAKAAFPGLVPDPGGENVHRRLMAIHQRAKDGEAEMRELAELMAFEPLNVKDRRRLAKHQEKDPRWWREIAAVQPKDKSVYDGLAAILASKKEHEAAIETRLIAVALVEAGVTQDEGRDKADEYCEIAALYLAMGKKDKAREYAKEALRASPGHERAQKLYEESTP